MTIVTKLNYDDPTVFAICSGACSQHGLGAKVGNYFGKAYTRARWARKPKCDNCKSPMKRLYEVSPPSRKERRS
jgi:hypothetical protein